MLASNNRLNLAEQEAGSRISWFRAALSAGAVLESAVCCYLAAEIAEYWFRSLLQAAKWRLAFSPVVSEWLVRSPQLPRFPGCSRPSATSFGNRKAMKFARHVIKCQRFRSTSDASQNLREGFCSDER
jgi:hypothetical protein